MTNFILLPEDDDRHLPIPAPPPNEDRRPHRRNSGAGRQRRRRRATNAKLPTLEELVAQLDALKGAVLAGWIRPAEANAASRILQQMIQCVSRTHSQRAAPGALGEILADIARRDHDMLDVLEPFLTDEQFMMIVGENLGEDRDSPAPKEPKAEGHCGTAGSRDGDREPGPGDRPNDDGNDG